MESFAERFRVRFEDFVGFLQVDRQALLVPAVGGEKRGLIKNINVHLIECVKQKVE